MHPVDAECGRVISDEFLFRVYGFSAYYMPETFQYAFASMVGETAVDLSLVLTMTLWETQGRVVVIQCDKCAGRDMPRRLCWQRNGPLISV